MKSKHKSSISETEGIKLSSKMNKDLLGRKNRKTTNNSAESIYHEIIAGNIAALSQGITLIESSNASHREKSSELLKLCLPHSGNSLRIGITGVPGVGKSTFIESFGKHLSDNGKKIAILAVDPTSQNSKGSILGDKTRMEILVKSKNVFIRPTPSGISLGGVARKTRETIILCEAAGFDTIIIETVGVGQSEVAVHSMVDFFILLKLAGAGDELQGIKRGIIEMADLIAINKADGDNLKNAKHAQQDFKNALHLYPPKESKWQPNVLLCSALNNEGILEIAEETEKFQNLVGENGHFKKNRIEQQKYWLFQSIEDNLKSAFYDKSDIKIELQKQIELLKRNETTVFAATEYLLNL
ncbi:methylmalonyl-CoA mutase metallochaperone MeaB [Flavobacteriaceae bacterium MAR_2010_188]|nr:methylmalonyl-CoA mutase metallochaperone MeaB [Flavobacteriaceae bacterium MAR_2010_188]